MEVEQKEIKFAKEKQLHAKLAKWYRQVRGKSRFYHLYGDIWFDEMVKGEDISASAVLDYGCGTGDLLPVARSKFTQAQITGIDLSPDMLAVAREQLGDDYILEEAPGEKLPFPNDHFDLVYARGVLHHLASPSEGAAEIFRVLKKGRYVHISEPHNNIITRLIRPIVYRLSKHFDKNHRSFEPNELQDILCQKGFEVEREVYWGLFAFPFSFPDIFFVARYCPNWLMKFLSKVDKIVLSWPMARKLGWHIIIHARKPL